MTQDLDKDGLLASAQTLFDARAARRILKKTITTEEDRVHTFLTAGLGPDWIGEQYVGNLQVIRSYRERKVWDHSAFRAILIAHNLGDLLDIPELINITFSIAGADLQRLPDTLGSELEAARVYEKHPLLRVLNKEHTL